MNIEGKRSGEGFVAHKATLVIALSRALADRIMLVDLTIGRKGLLGYLKALGGSNVVKRAKRVKVAFEKSGDTLEGVSRARGYRVSRGQRG